MNPVSRPVIYELTSTGGVALSPWCWHARMALAHKGIEPEIRQHCFTDKEPLKAAGGKSFPLLLLDDGTVLDDSMKIVMRLEEAVPQPTLFPGGEPAVAAYRFMHRHTQLMVFPSLIPLVVPHIPEMLEGEDHDYFITSRRERFGMSMDEVAKGADAARESLNKALEPFRRAITGGGYVSGSAPAMPDYLLFGVLQWARVSSPRTIIEDDDIIKPWMENILDLFDGLGRSEPARIA